MSIINLDFKLERDVERIDFIKTHLADKNFSKKELETMANYILFGKNENGKNIVDEGLVEIETKYKTYKRKSAESLEELFENPTFDENSLREVKRNIYTNPKPELNKNNPALQGILTEIEKWQHIYNVATGKETDESIPSKTPTEIYKIKHFLIELKKEQYLIDDCSKSVIQVFTPQKINSEKKNIFAKPLGLKIGNMDRFENPLNDKKSCFELVDDKEAIDFEDPRHVYWLLEFYDVLVEESVKNPYSDLKYLKDTLDFYIAKTKLAESRLDILKLKKSKMSNRYIVNYLKNKYRSNYCENYISTIYTKEICKKISDTVTSHKEEWLNRNNPSAWKICQCCKQKKLRTPKNFTRKKSNVDGYSTKCKECEK